MGTEWATIRRSRIAYETTGEGTELIWGHGLSQSRALEAAAPLVDWSRVQAHVTRYDARGHGESDSTQELSGYTWAALAQDQLALADHLGIDRYIAAGASMGCGTALYAAVQAPQRVAKLVLAIPPTAWETRAERAGVLLAGADAIESGGVERVIEAQAAMPAPDPYASDPDYQERSATATRSWDAARLALVMRGAAGADLPSRTDIAALTVPTLILSWTGDPTHPVETAAELARLIPHAEWHVASTAADLAGWTNLIAAFVR
jgi:3-oxoadipate enol-lactonase